MINNEILKILYENKDDYVSGENLASVFSISRAAISKRIEKLRLKGVNIHSVPNRGYKIISMPDFLIEESVTIGVPESQAIGNTIEVFDEIDSTNEQAKKIAKNASDGTIVAANVQTKGKGRRGREFESKKGGMYFSIILKPDVAIEEVPFITQMTACSINKALSEMGVDTLIKWPNDIILNDKKLCGILCEMSCEIDYLSYVVAGIGINLKKVDFEEEVEKVATSLEQEGYELDNLGLFWNILKNFDYFYQKYIMHDYDEMLDILRANSYILNKDIEILTSNEIKKARSKDIDEKGFLVVEYENGDIEHINYGEVSVRKKR
ncbi:biotin--[acetyl-CoA-carboxylase] ligase [[Eubacterium] yurii subsp. margaretiae ATCC 43715]|nr:biotin--[acetyl-CoA-carboxylase] ligase [[Eubacterium] yurii subsp. margaretiae ATCC 43715]